jgi:hypothetical protein
MLTDYKYKILLLIFIVMSCLPFISNMNINTFSQDISEYILTFDPGYSNPRNLIDDGNNVSYQSPLAKAAAIIKNIPNIIKYKLGIISSKKLDVIIIDIKLKNLNIIHKNRILALKNDYLLDSEEVSAKINYKNKSFKASIRLKGDTNDHYLSKYRYSLRVKLKGDNYILGFKTFSIQKPRSRQHPYEQIFQDTIRGIGNLAAKHEYVHVYFNGENWGIMNLEGHYDKLFLERYKKKDSIIIKLGDDKKWLLFDDNNKSRDAYFLSNPRLYFDIYKDNKYLKDIKFRYYYTYISESLLSYKNDLFDKNTLTKAYAFAYLWGNPHTLSTGNSKYYFNPYTLKLEIITTDQGYYNDIGKIDFIFDKFHPANELSDFNSVNIDFLASINVEKYYSKYKDVFPLDKNKDFQVLKDNLNRINIEGIKIVESKLNNNNHDYNFNSVLDHIYFNHYDNGSLYIYNLLPVKLKVKNIIVNNKMVIAVDKWVKGHSYSLNNSLHLNTNLKGNFDKSIEITTELNNTKRKQKNRYTLLSSNVINPLKFSKSTISKHIKKIGKNTYTFINKIINVNENIIVKGKVIIEDSTIINFCRTCIMIINGSLIVNGLPNKIVELRGLNSQEWGGIYVFNKGRGESKLSNIKIINSRNLKKGILELTGALTFYKTKLIVDNLIMTNINAEDALNIIESQFSINNSGFYNIKSDAIDIDYSDGTIDNLTMKYIGGDGVDLSGSTVDIKNVSTHFIKDKSISIGEKSNSRLQNIKVDNSGVGIAVKDGSEAKISYYSGDNIELYDIMVYVKKNVYNYPKVVINNSSIELDSIMKQVGSTVVYDNYVVKAREVNIDRLYKSEIMKK